MCCRWHGGLQLLSEVKNVCIRIADGVWDCINGTSLLSDEERTSLQCNILPSVRLVRNLRQLLPTVRTFLLQNLYET